jgi:hypothetical protein
VTLSEAQWVGQLVKACRMDYSGWAIRLSALQRYGCADLLLQLPGYQTALVECKVAHYPNIERTGGSITVETTPLQKETLRQIQQAGGMASVWILINDKIILVVNNPLQEYAKVGEAETMLKERNRPWPIAALIHRMKQGADR